MSFARFFCFSMPLDNHVWCIRAGIFNNWIRYSYHYVQYCYKIIFFTNLFNMIKSNLVPALPLYSFCIGVTTLF